MAVFFGRVLTRDVFVQVALTRDVFVQVAFALVVPRSPILASRLLRYDALPTLKSEFSEEARLALVQLELLVDFDREVAPNDGVAAPPHIPLPITVDINSLLLPTC